MEIPGDVFQPHLGNVNQTTFAPIGRLMPWKMTKCTLDIERDKVDTPNNAVPDFKTAINAKRGTTGKIEQASFDPIFTIYGPNPFSTALGGTFLLTFREGVYFRMACFPDTSVAYALPGEMRGRPIRGSAADLISAVALPLHSYFFLACRITKIHHMADAAAGQPFDFDFETVHAYKMPNEPTTIIDLYGFSFTVGVGGFL